MNLNKNLLTLESSGTGFVLDTENAYCNQGNKNLGVVNKNDPGSCAEAMKENKESCSDYFCYYPSGGRCECQALSGVDPQCISSRGKILGSNVYRIVTTTKTPLLPTTKRAIEVTTTVKVEATTKGIVILLFLIDFVLYHCRDSK